MSFYRVFLKKFVVAGSWNHF